MTTEFYFLVLLISLPTGQSWPETYKDTNGFTLTWETKDQCEAVANTLYWNNILISDGYIQSAACVKDKRVEM